MLPLPSSSTDGTDACPRWFAKWHGDRDLKPNAKDCKPGSSPAAGRFYPCLQPTFFRWRRNFDLWTKVSGHRVRFWTNQTPDPGYTKFYAYVLNDNTGAIVPNYQYIFSIFRPALTGAANVRRLGLGDMSCHTGHAL